MVIIMGKVKNHYYDDHGNPYRDLAINANNNDLDGILDSLESISEIEKKEKEQTIVVSDDELRGCVNDLLVVISSMQDKIEYLYNKIDKVEGKVEELL